MDKFIGQPKFAGKTYTNSKIQESNFIIIIKAENQAGIKLPA